jgi:hypothetical protein
VHHSKIAPPMTGWGQERRIGPVCNISALPPGTDVGADILEPPLRVQAVRKLIQQRDVQEYNSKRMLALRAIETIRFSPGSTRNAVLLLKSALEFSHSLGQKRP